MKNGCKTCKYRNVERIKDNNSFKTGFISNYYCNNDYSEWFCSSVDDEDCCDCYEKRSKQNG